MNVMDVFGLVMIGILGLCIGSFLNVVIDRLSEGRTLLGRSMCDFCKRVLSPLELVPAISFLVQKGYSRCCGNRLSWQYPTVEITTSVLYIAVWQMVFMSSGDIVKTASYLGIVSSLVVIVFADLRYRIIPDAALAALAFFKTVSFLDRAPASLFPHILAGLALFSAMALLFALTRGRGIGFGDVKFAGVIGYMLGLQNGFLALYIAFITGGLVAIGLLLTSKKGLKSEVPFGPFMVWGLVIAALFETQLHQLIQTLF